jgi:hypothetical protein
MGFWFGSLTQESAGSRPWQMFNALKMAMRYEIRVSVSWVSVLPSLSTSHSWRVAGGCDADQTQSLGGR